MDILTIATLELKRLKNAEHVQFHSNVRNIIEEADTEKLGLSDLVFNPFSQAIAAEQDIVNRATGSAFTPEMQEADLKRDLIYRRIHRKMELCEYEDPESEAYKAVNVVSKHFLAKYGYSVASLPYQEETATISGFIMDARNILTAEQIEAMGIDADLDDLQAWNRKFSKMYQERVGEKAAGDSLQSQKLRATTDQAFQLLSLTLNALANDPSEANHTKTEACRTALAKINVVVKDTKDRLAQRLGNGSQSEDGGDEEQGGTQGGSATPGGTQSGSSTPGGSQSGTQGGSSTPGGSQSGTQGGTQGGSQSGTQGGTSTTKPGTGTTPRPDDDDVME